MLFHRWNSSWSGPRCDGLFQVPVTWPERAFPGDFPGRGSKGRGNSCIYSWPLNNTNTGSNCTGPLTRGFFQEIYSPSISLDFASAYSTSYEWKQYFQSAVGNQRCGEPAVCIVLSFCIRDCDIQGFWGVCACVRPGTSPSIKRADCSRVVGTQVIGGFSMAWVSRSLTPVLFKGQLCFPCQPWTWTSAERGLDWTWTWCSVRGNSDGAGRTFQSWACQHRTSPFYRDPGTQVPRQDFCCKVEAPPLPPIHCKSAVLPLAL